jgi:23S rRNA (pseudouridine1915-N3)-methyltransferase
MQFRVVAIGKPRNADLVAAIRDYEARAQRYWPITFTELRDESARGRAPDAVRARDAARVRAAVGADSDVWLCDERGTPRTSPAFAAWMRGARDRARDIALVIGGAHGHDASLRDEASGLISLGTFTLPHDLARLVLAEQLYRAGTIVRGEPYHK